MISNIRHPNLVELIGCCVEGNNRILIYEYLENNSLGNALLGKPTRMFKLHSFYINYYELQKDKVF